jgi:hypothetical protein
MSVNKIKQWAELGECHCINDAARRVLELEGDYAINNFLLIAVPHSDCQKVVLSDFDVSPSGPGARRRAPQAA